MEEINNVSGAFSSKTIRYNKRVIKYDVWDTAGLFFGVGMIGQGNNKSRTRKI